MLYEIIVDGKETPNKCTITPLAGREDFRLFPVHGEGPLGPLSAPLLLHHEGQCLSTLPRPNPPTPALAAVDCVWRRLPNLMRRLQWGDAQSPALVRIPSGFRTVYPRTGRPDADPDNGLATIEAIFIASAFLGQWDPTLLSKYYFGSWFLEVNRPRFLELGINVPESAAERLGAPPRARDSLARRRNRGRMPKALS